MTLAGTRPPLLSETSLYELHHRARLAIKPGITGMWQVSGRSDKVNFAPLIDKDKKREKQAEFRNDVCSFANADGGYIFYGIGENSGAASILAGISIPNIDRFELDRRNELQAIRPTVPDVAFSFVSLQDDKYIVVLHIQRGLYKPYITEEPEGQFHFYIRLGNKKQSMSYTEIRNGFLNAAMLSEDIKSFRKERLEEHITEMKKPFALVQVIPATFRSDYVPMYDMYRELLPKFRGNG